MSLKDRVVMLAKQGQAMCVLYETTPGSYRVGWVDAGADPQLKRLPDILPLRLLDADGQMDPILHNMGSICYTPVQDQGGFWEGMGCSFYRSFGKRAIDIVLSGVGIVILLPIFFVIAGLIKLESRGPVLFRQKRVGLHKKTFFIMKFRTMRTDTPTDTPTHLLANPDRYITKAGRFLRKTSLDELPQIFNILKGDMAVIGPRPALWNQDDLVAERDKYGANDVLPGLTGWAQINGRDELEIPVKARLDGEYVQRMSLVFDAKCFFGTIVSIFKREGVEEGGTGEIHRMEQDKAVRP